jgi:DsbC/DsbD-like thiol-disulfide interchange protein
MSRWLVIFLVYFANSDVPSTSEQIVKVNVPNVTVYAGKGSVIILNVEVKEGYHIQANKVSDEFLIPTTVEITTDEKIKPGEQLFPAAKKFKLEGTNDFLDVYDGSFKISIPFKTQRGISKGKTHMQATLRYQACNFKTCLFPKTIDFTIQLTII